MVIGRAVGLTGEDVEGIEEKALTADQRVRILRKAMEDTVMAGFCVASTPKGSA